MPLTIEDILLLDDWTDAERQAVQDAVRADASLALAWRRWQHLSRRIHQDWADEVPAREALVLLACRDRWTDADLSPAERALLDESAEQLDALMASHPALERILARIRSEADAFESAWMQAAPVREDRGPLRPVRSSMRLLRRTLAAAAVVTLLVVGRQWIAPEPTSDLPSWAAAASWSLASLPDGSEVRIAPGTTLAWLSEEGAGERRVRLEGSAFFDVTAGPDPFRVETDEALTTVLGTSFGVRTREGTEVTLVSGRVSLAGHGGQSLILEPGQQGWLRAGMDLPEIRTVELGDALSWTELLIFRDTPMAEVVRQLSQAFNVTIILHESLKETPLTGTFESERGTKAILDIIGAALGATVTEVEAGRFELNPAPRN